MKNAICFLIDRFQCGFLGLYGNAEIETPAIDHLASESFVADRFYIDTTDVAETCHSWWWGRHVLSPNNLEKRNIHENNRSLISSLKDAGYATVLVTDDPVVAYAVDAGDFSDVQLLDIPRNDTPVDEIDATHFCQVIASVASIAEQLAKSTRPYFLWCQIRGFADRWDFPMVFREKYCGEDDPEPYANVEPPFFRKNEMESTTDTFDDVRQSVAAAYAGGMTMLDELLEILLGAITENQWGTQTLFLLGGTRGILLGEHDQIGMPLEIDSTSTPESTQLSTSFPFAEPLCSALVQVPLLIRFPDGFGATVRSDTLLQPADVTQMLADWLEISFDATESDTETGTKSDRENLLAIISEETQSTREHLIIVSSRETCDAVSVLVTPTWFLSKTTILINDGNSVNDGKHTKDRELDLLQQESVYALYVKPDDRHEVNNVSDRCRDIVEQLAAVLATMTNEKIT